MEELGFVDELGGFGCFLRKAVCRIGYFRNGERASGRAFAGAGGIRHCEQPHGQERYVKRNMKAGGNCLPAFSLPERRENRAWQ